MAAEQWVRVTGQTVYGFPLSMTGSQLTDVEYQLGSFKGDGLGCTSAAAATNLGARLVGSFDSRLEAIAAILRFQDVAPAENSVGIA